MVSLPQTVLFPWNLKKVKVAISHKIEIENSHISVIGLNFDFLSLNLIGFTLYGCFNVALFWVGSIQARS